MRLRRAFAAVVVLGLLGAAVVGAAAWWGWRGLGTPYRGFAGEETVLAVDQGTSSTVILRDLEAAGVLRDAGLARAWLVYGMGDPPLQAGEYRFTGSSTARQVLTKLIRGDVLNHPVTIVEGLDLEEIAVVLAGAGLGEESAFLAAMRDPSPIADWDPEAEDLEGYLFPSTYSFPRTTDEQEIVRTLVRTFRERWAAEVEPRLDERWGPAEAPPAERGSIGDEAPLRPTVRQVVTLASVVEKEAKIPDERPVIAGVYANRLARGIALYADPTVIYALKKLGRWDGDIRRQDLRVDSPYNTYRYPGLPPGPIASPGLASLLAAAAPAEVDHLYFVSRNDGTHVFSDTLAEHNRNVELWQKRYWRERRARERAEAEGSRARPPETPRDGAI